MILIHKKKVSLRSPFSPSHLNTGKPFGALSFLSPDEPPELLPFEPPELFLDSFAAAAAACAAEIVARSALAVTGDVVARVDEVSVLLHLKIEVRTR